MANGTFIEPPVLTGENGVITFPLMNMYCDGVTPNTGAAMAGTAFKFTVRKILAPVKSAKALFAMVQYTLSAGDVINENT